MKYLPYPQSFVDHIRTGGEDVYGNPAERAISDGVGKPCRSCLKDVPKGEEMLILAARPFPDLQPYAETGPIFLCANTCKAHTGSDFPPILATSPDFLLKGYDRDNRIIYGTGAITPKNDVEGVAERLLARDDLAYVDVRSARNNCFLTRITRDD